MEVAHMPTGLVYKPGASSALCETQPTEKKDTIWYVSISSEAKNHLYTVTDAREWHQADARY